MQKGGILDVHLMVDNPEHHFEMFRKAGADHVTFHHEVVADPAPVVARARALGLCVGIAFNPDTEPDEVAATAGDVDLVLCMGVHPGYSGQAYIPETTERVRRLRELLPPEIHIQVDGGVGMENVRELREAGADLFVAGSSVFAHEDHGRGLPRALRRGAVSLERALELAERGRGTTYPNPVVGAVLVQDGEVVGEGWHERKRRPARRGERDRRGRRARRAARRCT